MYPVLRVVSFVCGNWGIQWLWNLSSFRWPPSTVSFKVATNSYNHWVLQTKTFRRFYFKDHGHTRTRAKAETTLNLKTGNFWIRLDRRTRSRGSTSRSGPFRKTGALAGCRRRSRTSPAGPSPGTGGTGRTACSVRTPTGSGRRF